MNFFLFSVPDQLVEAVEYHCVDEWRLCWPPGCSKTGVCSCFSCSQRSDITQVEADRLRSRSQNFHETFLNEDYFLLPTVSTTPVVHLELRISPRIFELRVIPNGTNGIFRGLGETDSWKNLKSKISWRCSFKRLRVVAVFIKYLTPCTFSGKR